MHVSTLSTGFPHKSGTSVKKGQNESVSVCSLAAENHAADAEIQIRFLR